MSYASLDISVLPVIHLPTKAIHKTAVFALQSVGVAATLWLLLSAPGFLA